MSPLLNPSLQSWKTWKSPPPLSLRSPQPKHRQSQNVLLPSLHRHLQIIHHRTGKAIQTTTSTSTTLHLPLNPLVRPLLPLPSLPRPRMSPLLPPPTQTHSLWMKTPRNRSNLPSLPLLSSPEVVSVIPVQNSVIRRLVILATLQLPLRLPLDLSLVSLSPNHRLNSPSPPQSRKRPRKLGKSEMRDILVVVSRHSCLCHCFVFGRFYISLLVLPFLSVF